MSDVFGPRDVLIEKQDKDGKTIERLAELTSIPAAMEAYKVYVKSWPSDRIILRHRARIIEKSWEKE